MQQLKNACIEARTDRRFETLNDTSLVTQVNAGLPRDFIEIRLKPDTLRRLQLPDIPYPIPLSYFQFIAFDRGQLPYAVLLYGLQEAMASPSYDWRVAEEPASILTDLICGDQHDDLASASGHYWWFDIGPVDLTQEIVTVQRRDSLIVAMQPQTDGRLRVASYRPIDAKTAKYLTELSLIPLPDTGVCMRENNWEYALDCSAGTGNAYADTAGESYLSYWKHGLGLDHDKQPIDLWWAQRDTVAVNATVTATQVGTWYSFSDAED
jgi:hypothetical protein